MKSDVTHHFELHFMEMYLECVLRCWEIDMQVLTVVHRSVLKKLIFETKCRQCSSGKLESGNISWFEPAASKNEACCWRRKCSKMHSHLLLHPLILLCFIPHWNTDSQPTQAKPSLYLLPSPEAAYMSSPYNYSASSFSFSSYSSSASSPYSTHYLFLPLFLLLLPPLFNLLCFILHCSLPLNQPTLAKCSLLSLKSSEAPPSHPHTPTPAIVPFFRYWPFS